MICVGILSPSSTVHTASAPPPQQVANAIVFAAGSSTGQSFTISTQAFTLGSLRVLLELRTQRPSAHRDPDGAGGSECGLSHIAQWCPHQLEARCLSGCVWEWALPGPSSADVMSWTLSLRSLKSTGTADTGISPIKQASVSKPQLGLPRMSEGLRDRHQTTWRTPEEGFPAA